MSKEILLNRIDVQFNDEQIDGHFDFFKINCDLRGKQGYGKAITKIYEEVKPLSLCKTQDGYAVLVEKGATHTLNDSNYSVTRQTSAEMAISSKAKLLIGALPILQSEHQKCSEGAGLYYLCDVEPVRKVDVLRTYEVKIEYEQKQHLVLNIVAATFTPVSYHTNAEGKLYGDCTYLPKLKFDKWTQELTRSQEGEYIKKRHRDKKMSGEMVSLDAKNPGKYWRSKMGVLATFMEDVKRHLSGYMQIEFETLSPQYRARFKDHDIKLAYRAIDDLLMEYSINIINLTDSDCIELERALEKDGFNVTHAGDVKPNALNLAIHHDQDYYESRGLPDPYRQLRTEKDVIIQSAYPQTLIKNGKLSQSQYEACKKELFVKLEAMKGELLLVRPKGDWLFVLCHQVDRNTKVYDTLHVNGGKLSFERVDERRAQDSFLLDLPRQLKNNEHAVVDLALSDAFIFEDTKYVALPEYQQLAKVMSELADGYASGIKRSWVEEFLEQLDAGDIEVANPKMAADRLQTLLLRNPASTILYKEAIFNDKDNVIAYKGSLQTFFDWVAEEKGLRLAASLKGQDAGLIEASLGFFYNDEENLYFVGDKDNVKNLPRFCRIRRILTDAEETPEELLKMMRVFHIRHKQATVYPFPFKHLKELALAAGTPSQLKEAESV